MCSFAYKMKASSIIGQYSFWNTFTVVHNRKFNFDFIIPLQIDSWSFPKLRYNDSLFICGIIVQASRLAWTLLTNSIMTVDLHKLWPDIFTLNRLSVVVFLMEPFSNGRLFLCTLRPWKIIKSLVNELYRDILCKFTTKEILFLETKD